MERLALKTEDGKTLSADFYPAEGSRYVILLHMMPATKESWKEFAKVLQEKGISSIAIDQRGHGESEGGPGGYKEMTDEEQREKIWDVRAAWRELTNRGASMEKTALIGASIGANLSIVYLAENATFPVAVALSPGIDYRGVTTDDAIAKLTPGQSVLLIASDEDETSIKSVRLLNEKNPTQTTLIERSGLGHGTTMIGNDRELFDFVVNWVDERI